MNEIEKTDISTKEKKEIVEEDRSLENSGKELESLEHEDDGRPPTEEEMKKLRHVSEYIPASCWLVAVVELAERFSYYGLSTPFQNYMQNGPNDSPKGVLNMKNQGATALSYFWQFWCYVTPIFGAWVADTYFGKFMTICLFCILYMVGILILFVTSIPSIASKSTSLGGFVTAIIVIGLGTGGVKANVSPLIADQIPKTKPRIKTLKNGTKVIEDPNITIQNVFMFFYLMVNIGSLSVIATTEIESHVDFWAAYLLPLCFFVIALIALFLGRNKYVKVPVKDKIISKSFQASWVMLKNFSYDAAKPSVHPEKEFPWTDKFVEEIKRSLYACKVFVFYPIYWLVYGQMVNNFVSQAGDMELHGLPNDILQVIDSISIIIFIPIMERFFYPFVRRFTPFKAITKIFWGFMFASAAMIYTAALQHFIYKAGPCYYYPKACSPEYKTVPNHVHVAAQTPAYFLIAMSEIFASVTGQEYAYTKAPVSMKSFIMSLFLVTNAFGSAIGIGISAVSEDPKFIWVYSALAIAAFVAGCLFWLCFRHYNDREDEWNDLDYVNDEEYAQEHGLQSQSMPESHGLNPIVSLGHSVHSVQGNHELR